MYKNKCQFEENAEVKLLAFGDPQIQGVDKSHSSYRKQLDIYGNDRFLGHVYRTLIKNVAPDYVAVMGDLVSSQWIDDFEFEKRAQRFRDLIFDVSMLKEGVDSIFNISGNHDIGYAGEVTPERIDRFVREFGQLNYVKDLNPDVCRLVVLNSLVLDGPMAYKSYSEDSWQFLETQVYNESYTGTTILLTHVPLAKPEGICRDGPYFTYYGEEFGLALREQNHLSADTTERLLNLVFGNGKGGVILTGHDHEGCESVYHNDGDQTWSVKPKDQIAKIGQTDVYEITVRSMMGEYGGNGGLLSGQYNEELGSWNFTFSLCRFGVQHIWWAAQVLLAVSIAIVLPIYSLLVIYT